MHEVQRLLALIKELADDLASEIEGRYHGMKDNPAIRRRYERDMALVNKARRELSGG